MTSAPLLLPPLADPESLVKAMGKIHRRLVEDLRARAVDPRVEPSLREAWAADKKQGRTGESFETYRDAFCDQVGASWVLCTVFARTLEDRGYVPHRLAGPGAIDRQAMFRSAFKFLGERDYLLHIFDGISLLPGAREVFGPGHAPLWRLGPTNRVLGELLDELRALENLQLRFTFGKLPGSVDESGASTRYLGDLYQNLNEDVRKRYALLQTPDFVERFLLDNTLDPAIRERGYAVTVLDPACGSGHLLLGAYDRLFAAWRRGEPGREKHEAAKLALGQVFGIDLNPYAASVARFRLLLSYLDKAGITHLQNVPEALPLQVYVGDSLLAGRKELQAGLGDLFGGVAGFEKSPVYSLFNSEADQLLYKTKFDVVVANPPYITEKDAAKRELIRKQYKAAYREFGLSAPFAERIFQLGNSGAYTGQITANSFMKREFGAALVEKVFPHWELTQVIDTSGAFIPGHGTPTVILLGRSQKPVGTKVPVVMGIRGEPTTPEDPSRGKVWSSIAEHHRNVGFENEFISVAEVERKKLGKHPWSIGGGGAADLKDELEGRAENRLNGIVDSIGFSVITGEDNILMSHADSLRRVRLQSFMRRNIIGEEIRDWSVQEGECCIWPNNDIGERRREDEIAPVLQYLWSYRTTLKDRKAFGVPVEQKGIPWWALREVYSARMRTPLTIAFAEVATHNHFVLDRGGKVFKQTAPIIKLPEGATEDEHLALLGYLNSSTACFWMKQVCFDKGGSGIGRGIQPEDWMSRYAFNGSALLGMPLPVNMQSLVRYAKSLIEVARMREESTPSAILERSSGGNLHSELENGRRAYSDFTQQMIGLQEDLDWTVYELCGWTSVRSKLPPSAPYVAHPPLRAFEMILAEDKTPTAWFERHGRSPEDAAKPILDSNSATLLAQRIETIRKDSSIGIIETPDFKRRWEPFDWDAAVKQACESFLLTRAEAFFQSRDPRPLPIRTIAAELHRDPKVRAVAEVLTGSANVDLESLLADLCQQDAVASASCQVYSDEGIENRRAWERVWDLQRREDAGQKVDIEPPPKYDQKDFENAATLWRLRGKLDVPKERFIAYPTATPPPGASGKPGLVFGWAGWDHLQKLQAAIELWQEEMGLHGLDILPRATREQIAEADLTDERLLRDAAARQKLAPLLQTMVDLLPWVKQWHDEDGQTASAFEAYISEEARKLEMTLEEAHLYRRPAKVTLPKTRRAGTAAKAGVDGMVPSEEKPAKKPRGRKPKATDGEG